jgi:hypothetical protein
MDKLNNKKTDISELEKEEPEFPNKYTDDNGKRHKITSYAEYIELVKMEVIHPNTLVHNGKYWNYHARYANPDAENPAQKDKFASMWNKIK